MATARRRATPRPCADCNDLTPNQQMVLDAVASAGRPVSAYGVIDLLAERGKRVRPPTVYRALDGLTQQKLVHRLESLNSYVACSGHDHRHDSFFMICESCGAVEEFADDSSVAQFGKIAQKRGFEISRRTIELRGRCNACRR